VSATADPGPDGPSPVAPDVVDKALGALDHALDVVHDTVLRPIIIALRAVAYGLIVALCSVVLLLALVIGVTRLLNVYLFAGHEWITYASLGTILLVTGLILWRRRRPSPASS